MLKLCAKCGATASKKCTGCQRNYYCSIQCQKNHRAAHKAVCFPLTADDDWPQTPFVNALLIPVDAPPTLVSIKVAPVLTPAQRADIRESVDADGDSALVEAYLNTNQVYVQAEAFRVLSRDHALYKRIYDSTRGANPWETPFHEQPAIPSYAMILDSARESDDNSESENSSTEMFSSTEIFFFSGDNGYPQGVEMMQTLEPNKNLIGGGFNVRGPVLVVKAAWGLFAGCDFEKWGTFEEPHLTEQLRETVLSGIRRRYMDAGLIARA
jgi:hypothetical protein